MKKADLIVVFLLTAALLLSSCKNKVPGETENEVTPSPGVTENEASPSPDEGTAPGAVISGDIIFSNEDTGYVKLDDINPNSVLEIKIGPVDESFQYVKETEEGFLCGYLSKSALNVKAFPRIKKLDKEGNVVWEKQYNYETFPVSDRISYWGLKNIISYPDGSFIFSVQKSVADSNNSEKSYIMKCDRDGNELWKRDFDDYSCNAIRSLLVTEKGEIIVVGNNRFQDGKLTNSESGDFNIVITRFDRDGNMLQQKALGGKDSDFAYAAKYDKKLGIIFRGVTSSKEGEFAISKDRKNAQFAACVDENLNFKWVFHVDEGEHFIYDQFDAGDDCTYIAGGLNTGSIEEFLIKVDKDGKMVWKKLDLHKGLPINAVSVLKNGDIAIGIGFMNQGTLLILDKDGNMVKREDTAVGTITPTSDGGFIITTTREIKTVPMPITSSTVWYDTELVAAKYKNDYSMEWRKTYDKVKNDKGEDFVFPFEDGKLAVE